MRLRIKRTRLIGAGAGLLALLALGILVWRNAMSLSPDEERLVGTWACNVWQMWMPPDTAIEWEFGPDRTLREWRVQPSSGTRRLSATRSWRVRDGKLVVTTVLRTHGIPYSRAVDEHSVSVRGPDEVQFDIPDVGYRVMATRIP